MPRPSPFHSRTSALCESHSWQEWSGYLSANMYELEHTHEYYAIRTACGLFDLSPLYKYHIHGRDAARLLNRVVTRDVRACAVGQVMYTAWCDDDGQIIDDGTLARLAADSFRLTAADPTYHWLKENAVRLDVRIDDVSDSIAALSLQGPTSRAILDSISNSPISDLRYFRLIQTTLAGIPVTLSRTGYTGDLGYEIWTEPQYAERLWDTLMEAGQAYRLRAMGYQAMDMTRIEAGLLLINVDFYSASKTLFAIQKSSPLELGLGWTVKLEKDYFVGQRALQREHARGPAWATVGLEVSLPALEALYRSFGMPLYMPAHAWSTAVPVYANGQQIGKATSGTWSPILKKSI
ncbi:MAG: aminomethyltransferase family protein, partial [Anaerolineales bacterium]